MLLTESLLALASRSRGSGVILNLHTIDARPTRALVELLDRHFDFVHHDDLLDRMAQRRRRPFCLVTFDDAKVSAATRAAPVLDRMGVPAVFYVVTDFADAPAPLWFDDWEAVARVAPEIPPGFDLATLKRLPHAVVVERVERLCRRFGVRADPRDEHVLPMDWEQVRALHARGHTIGAHSTRHAILVHEDPDVACEDIGRSLAHVTRAVGTPCRTFAFPNGNYDTHLAQHAVRCGARTVMTTEPLWVAPDAETWRLPRVQLHGDATPRRHARKLAAARLGFVLRNPDGTGREYVVGPRRGKRPEAVDAPREERIAEVA